MNPAIASPYKSPLHEMTHSTPTCLWNDSASMQELLYSIEHGAVGATCNPVIVLGVLKKDINSWKGRIHELIRELPTATEDEIAWQLVREISVTAAAVAEAYLRRAQGQERPAFHSDRSTIISEQRRDPESGGRV